VRLMVVRLWCFRLALLTSVAFLVTIVISGIVSHWLFQAVGYQSSRYSPVLRYYEVSADDGWIHFASGFTERKPGFYLTFESEATDSFGRHTFTSQDDGHRVEGFSRSSAFRQSYWLVRYEQGYEEDYETGDVFVAFRVWRIRYWVLALPVAGACFIIFRMRLRKYGVGQCQKCGYDLRATPNRCPECGSISKEKGCS
jgi:hypothetical protein